MTDYADLAHETGGLDAETLRANEFDYPLDVAFRAMLVYSAQLCEMAGSKKAARRLAACPVNPGARYSCVIRFTRAAETALIAGPWGTPVGGAAIWSVMTIRALVYRALTDPRPGLKKVATATAFQLESEIRSLGAVPKGTIWPDAETGKGRKLDRDDRGQDR